MTDSPGDFPLISVVMAVYNGEAYLSEAIESILNQTYSNFEFIIVDDYSTDASRLIILDAMKKDSRIRLLENEQNMGLAFSLNKGIQLSSGMFIARMDADDISLPKRFETQLQEFLGNEGLLILGSAVKVIDEKGEFLYHIHPPVDGRSILWSVVGSAKTPFIHPSVMFRKTCFDKLGFFNDEYLVGQDYEFWSRLLLLEMGEVTYKNLKDILLVYRHHGLSVSSKLRHEQIRNGFMTRGKMIKFFETKLSKEKFFRRRTDPLEGDELAKGMEQIYLLRLAWKYFMSIKRYPIKLNLINYLINIDSLSKKLSLRTLWQVNSDEITNLPMFFFLLFFKFVTRLRT